MLDASNDHVLAKMYPINVRIFGINCSYIMKTFFDMNLIEGVNASIPAAIFPSVDKLPKISNTMRILLSYSR